MGDKKKFGEVSQQEIEMAKSAAPDDLKDPLPLNIKNEILDWIEALVFAVFVVVLLFTFFLRVIEVKGNSMCDTLDGKDRLIISHFRYTPKKNDVVIANSRVLNEVIIKRIIGTGGDRVVVDYRSNTVTVNGEKIDENYKREIMFEKPDKFDSQYKTSEGVYEYTVPENCVFLMGDNRNHSTDSREIGFVQNDDILGKALYRIYPFDELGKVK